MASYIKERTKNAQFIVISLRNNMVNISLPTSRESRGLTGEQFELASRLVGVYKVNHMVCRIMNLCFEFVYLCLIIDEKRHR